MGQQGWVVLNSLELKLRRGGRCVADGRADGIGFAVGSLACGFWETKNPLFLRDGYEVLGYGGGRGWVGE